jgi:hypothetical protein
LVERYAFHLLHLDPGTRLDFGARGCRTASYPRTPFRWLEERGTTPRMAYNPLPVPPHAEVDKRLWYVQA